MLLDTTENWTEAAARGSNWTTKIFFRSNVKDMQQPGNREIALELLYLYTRLHAG